MSLPRCCHDAAMRLPCSCHVLAVLWRLLVRCTFHDAFAGTLPGCLQSLDLAFRQAGVARVVCHMLSHCSCHLAMMWPRAGLALASLGLTTNVPRCWQCSGYALDAPLAMPLAVAGWSVGQAGSVGPACRCVPARGSRVAVAPATAAAPPADGGSTSEIQWSARCVWSSLCFHARLLAAGRCCGRLGMVVSVSAWSGHTHHSRKRWGPGDIPLTSVHCTPLRCGGL